jgi:hypothetical protein
MSVGNDRNARDLGEFHQARRSVGVDDAAAGDDQRTLGLVQHCHRFFDLPAARLGLVHRQRFVGVGIEFDLGDLHVEGQIDQHRPGTAGAHEVEGLLEGARNLRRLAHGQRPLGDRLCDRFDVHRLEVFLVKACARRLAGNTQDGNRIGCGRVEAGDHVGARRARGADAYADVAGAGARVALGHVRGTLDMAREIVVDASDLAHRRVERVDRRAGKPERSAHPFVAQHLHPGFSGSHPGHGLFPTI